MGPVGTIVLSVGRELWDDLSTLELLLSSA